MIEILLFIILGALAPALILRKAVLVVLGQVPANNMVTFTNTTDKRLHLRKLDLTLNTTGAVAGDEMSISIDEVPIAQMFVNDSRSHIMGVTQSTSTDIGTAAASLTNQNAAQKVLSFQRDDLVLDVDESVYLNGVDSSGAPTFDGTLNIWYEA